ncbi:MAG TPA: fructose-bisphosphatase class II, partial [Holophagaceae bacterium]|nr:fructose-bisphosphatase class II [Holophagaceae bacterium]HXC17268.1 fructose-bisphosphatase class II [Holophagaceae bacterium]
VDTNTASREKAEAMGARFDRIYMTEDLAPGNEIVFAASGVTTGNLLEGVRFFSHGIRTSSLILTYQSREIRFIDTVKKADGDVTVRF